MKKLLSLLLVFSSLTLLGACGKKPKSSDKLPTVLNTVEYSLYQNVFYNEQGGNYVGKTFKKTGVFTTIYDAFSGRTRYYVWGYNDNTKCCDWQWEFVPAHPDRLPDVGSQVEVTGKFTADTASLDGYWLTDASVTVKVAYAAPDCDLPLTTMGGTLERVQLINIRTHHDVFEGKTVACYGRVSAPGTIEDPYYNGSWTQSFTSSDTLPAIGTMVILRGTVRGGVVADCTVTPTENY